MDSNKTTAQIGYKRLVVRLSQNTVRHFRLHNEYPKTPKQQQQQTLPSKLSEQPIPNIVKQKNRYIVGRDVYDSNQMQPVVLLNHIQADLLAKFSIQCSNTTSSQKVPKTKHSKATVKVTDEKKRKSVGVKGKQFKSKHMHAVPPQSTRVLRNRNK